MIRIHRTSAPAVLESEGVPAMKALTAQVQRDPNRVVESNDFQKDIYGHADVKAALIQTQRHKCAFCEAKITHVSFGHVEHFRPKGGYKQKTGESLHRPGSYWLAYAWDNLLLACELCNSRYKGNLFPLADPTRRATAPEHALGSEQPLFVNPCAEDPAEFIRFRGPLPCAVRNNRRGRQTILSLGLKREELSNHRRDRLRFLVQLWKATERLRRRAVSEADVRLIRDNEAVLRSAAVPDAEYSAMVRDFLDSVGLSP